MLDNKRLEKEILVLLRPIDRAFLIDDLEITTSQNQFIKTIQWVAKSSHFTKDLQGGGHRYDITEKELAQVIARRIEKELEKNN